MVLPPLPMSPVEVHFETKGGLGLIRLDRPRALNALSQDMCQAIDRTLAIWAKDDGVRAVLIRGEGGRAFCAGGDIRAVHDDGIAARAGESRGARGREFFRDEYRMNRRIRIFPKPYVALMDGITMGGGVGLSIHGSRRVATERTLLAMPETGIGLFPDVGTSYVLPRLPAHVGLYLALTGGRLEAGDLVAFGIATHAVSSAALPRLTEELILAADDPDVSASIDRVLAGHAMAPGPRKLSRHRTCIERCFGCDRVEDILAALDENGSAFATNAAAAMRAASPTSLKITRAEMRRGLDLDFEECLGMEYRLAQAVLAGVDFYEGVRAQLIDKDRNPRWRPDTLAAVDDRSIEAFFLPPADGDLTFVD